MKTDCEERKSIKRMNSSVCEEGNTKVGLYSLFNRKMDTAVSPIRNAMQEIMHAFMEFYHSILP